ncbi:STAS domain-containing protein [Micromonospora pattaloongensis]|uniref:STAS domain-containing protein n=1 Tax=Micromonospora pattaloongensis TaxID=405436 RepID=A0A1H3FJT7_9ACTN|nr:STAS domain-containing protein [Micromonospora pattaloongensis]SDX91057.1 STAS domain-containing protein [Micromonospora pattaloongensis]
MLQRHGETPDTPVLELPRRAAEFAILSATGRPGLRLVGEVDCATRHILDAALETLCVDAGDVHLDLAELTFIDVGGATSLVLWASRLRQGCRMILHDPPYELRRIIDMLWGQPATIEVDPP